MTTITNRITNRITRINSLDEKTALLMGFKKVLVFMGQQCYQIEGDPANNNIPWSPTTNANDAMMIMKKYGFILSPRVTNGEAVWVASSEYAEAYDVDPLVAICNALLVHARRG